MLFRSATASVLDHKATAFVPTKGKVTEVSQALTLPKSTTVFVADEKYGEAEEGKNVLDKKHEEQQQKVDTPMVTNPNSTASIFGSGTSKKTIFGGALGGGSTDTFGGQPSGFGSSGIGFGGVAAAVSSATKTTSSMFGTKKADNESVVPSTLSTTMTSSSSSGLGGGSAFLNIKPPGSNSGCMPQFSFGTSGS